MASAATLTEADAPELQAPGHWRTLEFVSDVHLSADEPATAGAWLAYLAATRADAVFILGDLFEVWIGDDALQADADGFVSRCTQALRSLSQRSALYFMHGNRDFLAGPGLQQACGWQSLSDPTVLALDGQRLLLSHGDALCLDDTAYLAFRDQVRSPAWQAAFLARPLSERQATARQLRAQSRLEQAQRLASGAGHADVDAAAARALLARHGARLLVHGHTHRPARHALGDGLHREVLSDWDAAAQPPRAQVLRLHRQPAGAPLQLVRQALPVAGG